jgi:hypothetical protein
MITIHAIIQKVFVLGIAFCFMFVAIYIPQSWNKVDQAEAAFATKGGQFMQNATALLQLAQDKITSAATVATKWFQSSLWTKEWVLDGLGWWVAKMILSQVTRSIVQWINSGFQGSPSFVQDLEGFALRMADQAAGLYLANLGSPLLTQFVCAPFRLNLQIAISTSYRYNRSGMPYGASRCTITNAMQNIDRFTDGSFIHGGWNAFYQMSSQPLTYTPYGEYLAAQNELALRASVSVRNENRLLNFGNGFFSSKVCDMVQTAAVPRERCMVSTPGQVISENLNFHLTAGSRSLIAADELNEILGALLGQLAQTAITGANGLLGMSNNTGYTLPQGVEAMENEQDTIGNTTKSNYLTELDAQIAREQKYRDAITQIIPMLQAINNTESLAEAGRATMLLNETIANLTALDAIRNDFINETVPVSELITRYSSLRNLHSDSQIEADVEKWTNQFIVIYTAYKTAVDDGLEEISQYRPRLVLYTQTHNGQYANEAREEIDLIDQVYQPALEADKLALEQVAREWSDPNIPRVDVVNHFIDIKNGVIAPPALVTQEDVDKKTRQWDDILNQP